MGCGVGYICSAGRAVGIMDWLRGFQGWGRSAGDGIGYAGVCGSTDFNGRGGMGLAYLECVLRAGIFVGVDQVWRGFHCVDWAAKIDFFWPARLAAPHTIGLYLPLL